MKRTTAIVLVGGFMLSMHAACGSDGDSSSTSTGSSSSTGTGSSTGSAMQTCSQCLQEAALSTTCKMKTTTCLSDQGAGGAGGAPACTSCYDWSLTCQTKTLDECSAAKASLCADSLVLAQALQDCTCMTCQSLCASQCM